MEEKVEKGRKKYNVIFSSNNMQRSLLGFDSSTTGWLGLRNLESGGPLAMTTGKQQEKKISNF